MKKIVKITFAFVLCLITMLQLFPKVEINAESVNHLIINQVYGSAGKGETPISHDFIELYNPMEQGISLQDYSLVYGGQSLPLNDVVLPSHSSYLVRGKTSGNDCSNILVLDNYDQEWDMQIDNKVYTITLQYQNSEVDRVSADDNNVKVSKQKTLRRIDFTDTDANTDFEVCEYKNATLEFVNSKKPRSLQDGTWGIINQNGGNNGNQQNNPPIVNHLNTVSENGILKYLGSYSTGAVNADGGVAEIVKYNADNKCMYLVSGQFQSVDIVSLEAIGSANGMNPNFERKTRINVAELGNQYHFEAVDITSVDVNTVNDIVAIAVQAADYEQGTIVLLDYEGNYITHFKCGIQPDMITFTKDGKYLLTANEGEPRDGYGAGCIDPKGSVTVVELNYHNLSDSIVDDVDFTAFDLQREQLINDKVLLKKDTLPSVDLEPEYIAIHDKIAYVSLQENNAIATLDIENRRFTSIKGLGLKDHNLAGNELDLNKNDTIQLQNENVYGIYMPDGLATVMINGVTYVLTANEGDAREWGTYSDIDEKKINGSTKNVELVKASEFDGLDVNSDYTFGARSFSIWKADTMEQVYDSGSQFAATIVRVMPEVFNSNHKELGVDGRSNKKGCEPEDVKTLDTGYAVYAFIGLERSGGVMMYDISNPSNAFYVDYLNIRDTQNGDLDNGSDLGAEGLCVVEAMDSPTGKPLLLVANEVSGTVSIMELQVASKPKANTETINVAKKPSKSGVATKDTNNGIIYVVMGGIALWIIKMKGTKMVSRIAKNY